jgi:lipopolysaccharide transport system permease protein
MSKLVIESGRSEKHYWTDLWRFRELFWFLAWRDVLVRYKQTAAGVGWALLRPFLAMVIMTVVFGRVAGFPSTGTAPYAIMVYAAMLPWQFFSSSVGASSESLLGSANLISKIYFPRLVVPGSAVVVSFVDFMVSFLIMGGLMAWYGYWPDWRIVALPLFMAMALLAALGPGLLFTALIVRYRDFRFIVPFVVQFGIYVTPVGFSSAVVRQKFGDTFFKLYSLNPMVGVVDGFRWSLLRGQSEIYWPGFAVSLTLALGLLLAGIAYFRKVERTFADVI